MEMNNILFRSLWEELIVLNNNIAVLYQNPEFRGTILPAMEYCSLMLRDRLPEMFDNNQLTQMIRLIYPMIECLAEMDNIPEDVMEKTSHLLETLINKTLNFDETIQLLEEQNRSFEDVMAMQFKIYQKRKKDNELYSKTDLTPQMLIKEYYSVVDQPRFQNLLGNFKKKYIENECMVENVHTTEERAGMSAMYNYVLNVDKNSFINIFTLNSLHRNLFSAVPNPEFGGKFADSKRYIINSGVSLVPAEQIIPAINSLFQSTLDLVEMGRQLGTHKNPEGVLPYINQCIELNCRLIKIHPFSDGNGRTIRAFTNLLFSLANIPPVYIKSNEKEEYFKAMNKALSFNGEKRPDNSYDISLNDTTAIKKFYYYKICDSLIDLDVKKRIKSYEKENHLKYKV